MLMFISIKAICFLAGLLIGFLMNIIAILLEKLNELVKTGSRRYFFAALRQMLQL